MPSEVDVLVPTCGRPGPLAALLACLLGQTHTDFRLVVSDQTEGPRPAVAAPEVVALLRVLRVRGHQVDVHRHLPRRGLAEHRDFLLGCARAPYALFVDDDVLLEPDVLSRLVAAIERERCGFIGSFVNAPSAVRSRKRVDEPLPGIDIEWWAGRVQPEVVVPDSPAWDRRHIHFAARLRRLLLRQGLPPGQDRLYKVAWVGGCVLYDVAKLREVGGFGFWSELPHHHCGEDVLAQLRLMARHGGAGLAPSGAWHQEVPTTVADRSTDAPRLLPLSAP